MRRNLLYRSSLISSIVGALVDPSNSRTSARIFRVTSGCKAMKYVTNVNKHEVVSRPARSTFSNWSRITFGSVGHEALASKRGKP